MEKNNQVRIPIISDGHCLVRAFFKVLTNEYRYPLKSYFKLLHCACYEIENNLPFYSDKITSDTDVSYELDKYKRERKYNQNIVDLIIYALANSTNSLVSIYYIRNGVLKTHEIPPTRDCQVPERRVTLVRLGENYEAVLNADTFKRNIENTVTIVDSSVKRESTILVPSDSEGTQGRQPKEWKQDSESELENSDECMNTTYSDNSSTDSDLGKGKRENVSPIKLTLEVWEDIPITKCTALPPDIDGSSVYELPFDANYRMRSSVDGRKWKRYMPSKRFGFKGMRRLAHCAGSFLCNNLLCSFRKQWGQNAVHFDKKNNCKYCGMTADYLPCKARKVWEFNDARETVTVYHMAAIHVLLS